MNNGQRIKLKDIAEELNTSINTVSHALRDLPDISVEMKNKVKKKAMELGYVGNVVATEFRTGSSKSIAIIFDDLLNPYFSIMNNILIDMLKNKGYLVSLFRLNEVDDSSTEIIKVLERNFDGIISFIELDEGVVQLCQKIGQPIVLLGRKNKYVSISTITTNDKKGGYLACKALVEAGCKNPGYIGAPNVIECSRRRKDGFREYLGEHDLPLKQELYVYKNDPMDKVDQYIDYLLDRNVDGIFFFSDSMAYNGLKYIINKGYKVPEDIKIVGYDDLSNNYLCMNKIDSIGCDKISLAAKVIEVLLDKTGNNQIVNEQIDVFYVKGDTVTK